MSMHKQAQAAFKVGLLTLISLVLLGAILVWLQGRALQQGQEFSVLFADVDGLRQGATVQMMGIRVGFVDKVQTDISRHKYAVRVNFTVLRPDVKIPMGSTLTIEQAGLVGEKFVEITPPHLQATTLRINQNELAEQIRTNLPLPVKMQYQKGLLEVGRVEVVERDPELAITHTAIEPRFSPRYRFLFRVVRPGSQLPIEATYRLVFAPNAKPFLLALSKDKTYIPPVEPVGQGLFTVENPIRFKEFIAVQIASAEALKETNDRLNKLLDDATIADIQQMLANLRVISVQAQSVMNNANSLFQTLEHDLGVLVKATDGLTGNLNALGKNLNSLLGDPQLRTDLKATTQQLKLAAENVNVLMQDPALRETLANTSRISQDLSEISTTLKGTIGDPQTQQHLQHSLQQLDDSLTKLSVLLSQVEGITNDQDPALRGIVEDTRQTTENLRKFSQRLNGRFLLWRLLF